MGSARINTVRQRLSAARKWQDRSPIKLLESSRMTHSIAKGVEPLGDLYDKLKSTQKGSHGFYADPIEDELDMEWAGSALEPSPRKIPLSRVKGTGAEEDPYFDLPQSASDEDRDRLEEISKTDSELSRELGPYPHHDPQNLSEDRATITKPNAEKWAKSARIEAVRQRLGYTGKHFINPAHCIFPYLYHVFFPKSLVSLIQTLFGLYLISGYIAGLGNVVV